MIRTSLLYWYPKLESLAIPMPKTAWVECDPFRCLDEDDGTYVPEIAAAVDAKVRELGLDYPVFLRTDLCAGKHSYSETCFAGSADAIPSHIWGLADDNLCKDLLFGAIVVREFLQLDARFTAFRGLPIAPERRYFVEDGEVICHHPYWPEDAIQFWGATRGAEPPSWRHQLAAMNAEWSDEVTLLSRYAQTVSSVLEGAWSVDFAMTRDGTWHLIDMAEACVSYHPPDCSVMGGRS